jgi:hypothetical protein
VAVQAEDLVEVSAEALRAMQLPELQEFLYGLGLSIEGIDSTSKALTRLMTAVYAVEV